ncbi:hypothetical protein LFL96_36945 (plasmid) [Paraburkholderia sp. D15]|uniref:hypothetical protein n=1 Tax=Paraburkholderia sp. D15 TaxID=2880218 RepID=UPI00247AF9EB|nr:hypothetical protein [Paraburkholderia sp. D15]WGS55067.1 hypothetical protein LFL96_36945 [Paraburkholderia sp. D15]
MSRLHTRSQLWGSVALTSTLFLTFFLTMTAATAGQSPAQATGLAALTTFAIEYARRQKLARLQADLARSARSTECVVRINGVTAGSLPEPEYIELRIRAMLSLRNYVGQFIEVLRFVLTCAATVLVAGPLLILWVLVIASAVAPETVRHDLLAICTALSSAPATASAAAMISQLARTVITMTATLGMLTFGVVMFFSNRFPIASAFQRDVDEELRRRTGSPVRGDVSVSRSVAHGAGSATAIAG